MDDEILNRYTRQLRLQQFDHSSQSILLDSSILIIGLGGLGSPAAMYLAAAGIGHLRLADFDSVDLSNLHRQILYDESNIGQKKISAARSQLKKLNSKIEIDTLESLNDVSILTQAVNEADIVLDCTDNFKTRFAINKACFTQKTPLVSGAAIKLEGQIAIFNDHPQSPCYACLYHHQTEEFESCSEIGVLGPVVGIVGCIQAMEAIKLLTNIGDTLSGQLLLIDAESMNFRKLNLVKDPDCAVCSHPQN